ncbi:CaiB/BaiF CoA-transferase family protein [Sporichthya brevicatena]|uniref:CaiB/BaiF CoA-transferase family protein n=1 Tax=Sporichthya brevicatena TaxID=171442 RepID=A0ABP3S0U2_9ACTN
MDRAPTGRPLHGVRVLDLSTLGPGPFCSMLLADFGADVLHVERPSVAPFDPSAHLSRGKRSAVVDLRSPRGAEVIGRLADRSDVLLESNRPGTMERRGLGPDVLCARNPRLIYARLTGWGQDGPYADRAGHDINYLAISGALGVIGEDRPVPPLAMLGDLAAGSVLTAFGIVTALLERAATGHGQVVDAAITDGAALLSSAWLAELNAGVWAGRGRHLLSGVAPFYGVYACSDGGWFAVGAIEEKFYAQFLDVLGLADVDRSTQLNPRTWPALRARVAGAFAGRPRPHWETVFAGVDGCGTPVLDLDELPDDPHLAARGTVVRDGDRISAAPAPRLSRTPARPGSPAVRGADTAAALTDAGYTEAEIAALVADGTVA